MMRRTFGGIALFVLVLGGLTGCIAEGGPAPTPTPRASAPTADAGAGAGAGIGKSDKGGQPAGGDASPCQGYADWWNNDEVKSALAKASYWPEIIAEAEKAAAGKPFDTAKMQHDFDDMEKVAQRLRDVDASRINDETVHLADAPMGLASRLAGGLADGKLDAKGAASAVTELQAAIADYSKRKWRRARRSVASRRHARHGS